MRIVHWFRRDLRLTDNPALSWALAHASTLDLVYIHAPQEEAPWAPGAASRWWLHASLQALSAQLAQRGASLNIRSGNSHDVLQTLLAETRAEAISWNRLYEPAALRRDQALEAELTQAGISVHTANAQLLLEPWQIATKTGTPYRVFTPFWKTARQQLDLGPVLPPAEEFPASRAKAGLGLEALRLVAGQGWSDKLAEHWSVGEPAALRQLANFVEQKLAQYAHGRDRPGQAGTSRLSPHLHWGELGPRQILAAVAHVEPERSSPFVAELGWREFSHHLLFHFPHCTEAPLNPRFAKFPWRQRESCAADLGAWQQGRTGIDFVDAGMQELWQTGWMHNRMRMICGSLLTKNLGIDWRLGAAWFWDTLVDANLANNTFGWQWIAGCGADAAPYFRIFNPDTQADKFDADGVYRRRWLGTAPRPPALLDLKTSRARALAAYARTRA